MLGARLKAMVASHEIAMGESKAALKSPAFLSVNLGTVVSLLRLTTKVSGAGAPKVRRAPTQAMKMPKAWPVLASA